MKLPVAEMDVNVSTVAATTIVYTPAAGRSMNAWKWSPIGMNEPENPERRADSLASVS